jgi:hypothetical protein
MGTTALEPVTPSVSSRLSDLDDNIATTCPQPLYTTDMAAANDDKRRQSIAKNHGKMRHYGIVR